MFSLPLSGLETVYVLMLGKPVNKLTSHYLKFGSTGMLYFCTHLAPESLKPFLSGPEDCLIVFIIFSLVLSSEASGCYNTILKQIYSEVISILSILD